MMLFRSIHRPRPVSPGLGRVAAARRRGAAGRAGHAAGADRAHRGRRAARDLANNRARDRLRRRRSEEPTSELQSLMRISYAVLCLKKKELSSVSEKDSVSKKKQWS